MSVRLRLTRIGSRKNPVWRVVVADQRAKRDGRVIEIVGHYNAQTNPSTIVLDEERIRDWLARGAQPTGRSQSCCAPRASISAAAMKELLEYLARGLVEHPDQVSVNEVKEDDGATVLELSVADDDYGNIIGRGGRTAAALRTVVKTAAARASAACSSTSSTGDASDPLHWLHAGRVGRPHGLDGSFHVDAAERATAAEG